MSDPVAEEQENGSEEGVITGSHPRPWPADEGAAWRLVVQERLDHLHEDVQGVRALLADLIKRQEQPYKLRELCMSTIADIVKSFADAFARTSESGGLKWIALSITVIAVVASGLGTALTWGDISISFGDDDGDVLDLTSPPLDEDAGGELTEDVDPEAPAPLEAPEPATVEEEVEEEDAEGE